MLERPVIKERRTPMILLSVPMIVNISLVGPTVSSHGAEMGSLILKSDVMMGTSK